MNVLHRAERDYYQELLMNSKYNIKQTWTVINRILRRGKRQKEVNNIFKKDNKVVTGTKNIANSFNTYFTNIGPTLANTLNINKDNNDIKGNHRSFMKGSYSQSMYLKPANESEILSIIKNFKSKKSYSFDTIKMSTIKKNVMGIVSLLTHICNLSLKSGKVPDKMKIAKVVPIYLYLFYHSSLKS